MSIIARTTLQPLLDKLGLSDCYFDIQTSYSRKLTLCVKDVECVTVGKIIFTKSNPTKTELEASKTLINAYLAENSPTIFALRNKLKNRKDLQDALPKVPREFTDEFTYKPDEHTTYTFSKINRTVEISWKYSVKAVDLNPSFSNLISRLNQKQIKYFKEYARINNMIQGVNRDIKDLKDELRLCKGV